MTVAGSLSLTSPLLRHRSPPDRTEIGDCPKSTIMYLGFLLRIPMAECILDGNPAVGEVDGFLLRAEGGDGPRLPRTLSEGEGLGGPRSRQSPGLLGKTPPSLGHPERASAANQGSPLAG